MQIQSIICVMVSPEVCVYDKEVLKVYKIFSSDLIAFFLFFLEGFGG